MSPDKVRFWLENNTKYNLKIVSKFYLVTLLEKYEILTY